MANTDIANPGADEAALYGALLQARNSNRKVAALGDSIIQQGNGINGVPNRPSYMAVGFMPQAWMMSMCRFEWSADLNFGVSGDDSGQALARVNQVIAAKPAVCVVLIGTNDPGHGLTPEQSIANITAIYDALNGAGIRVLAIPVLPRGGVVGDAARTAHLNRINRFIKREAFFRSTQEFLVVPCDKAIVNPADLYNNPLANTMMTPDGLNLHPQAYGAMLIAQPLSAALDRIFEPANNLIVSNGNAFHVTDNPTGSINPNPILAGTGGVVTAPLTGVSPAGWTLFRTTGTVLGAVGSKDATDDALVITISGPGGGNDNETVRLATTTNISTAGLVAGTKYIAEFDVETSGLSNVRSLYAIVQPSGTSGPAGLVPSNASGFQADREIPACRRLIRTTPFTITAPGDPATLTIMLYMICDGRVVVAGVVKVRLGALRQVFD